MNALTDHISLREEKKHAGAHAAVEFAAARKAYGEMEVLKGIDLRIQPGERLVLIGPSGCGKSTLLRCVNGLETLSSGIVQVEGRTIPERERDLVNLRRNVGMVFQQFSLFPHLTALENLCLAPRKVLKQKRPDIDARARRLLEAVGLSHKADSLPSQLSGGQQQRVAIARSLMLEPRIMLFDEVTSALDPELVGEVMDVMKQLADTGMTLIVVTHEMALARDLASHVVFMDGGVIVEQGPPDAVLVNPQMERTQRFLKRFS